MDESRIRASRRRIGFLVAVPLAGAGLWAGLAMAASGPTRDVPSRVHQNAPRQHRLHPTVVPHVVHTGHQCPFHDSADASL
jgi:hypothetical protein